jgi:quinohemoprotein ethanol dehydrogenase
VGWGGGTGLVNPPGMGPVKPGFGRILTFGIGGNAKLEVPAFGHKGPPRAAIQINASRATVREGQFLYASFCFMCHGVDGIAGASIPDLRYASAEVHQQFQMIVIGGARESRGMPSFADLLTPNQVRAIQAYVLSRAAASAEPPFNKAPESPDPAHKLQ